MRILSVGSKWRESPGARRAHRGVTLVELVLVLAIMGLLAGLTAPRMTQWLDDWRLRVAAERIAQTLRAARSRAVYEQQPVMVELVAREHKLRVSQPDSGFRREFDLPAGIEWGEEEGSYPSEVWRVLLRPSGAVEERTVWLRNRAGKTRRIHMDFLLGSAGVEVTGAVD